MATTQQQATQAIRNAWLRAIQTLAPQRLGDIVAQHHLSAAFGNPSRQTFLALLQFGESNGIITTNLGAIPTTYTVEKVWVAMQMALAQGMVQTPAPSPSSPSRGTSPPGASQVKRKP